MDQQPLGAHGLHPGATLLTSTAIHSVRNSPIRNGAHGDEAGIESAMPVSAPYGNAFGPDPAGVSR